MRVENIISDKGNAIANQFVMTNNHTIVFQSYESMIATIDTENKIILIGVDYDYSVTTGKYRNIFFRDYAPYELNGLKDLSVLRRAIEKGFYGDYKVETTF